jgi:hypothetical protein
MTIRMIAVLALLIAEVTLVPAARANPPLSGKERIMKPRDQVKVFLITDRASPSFRDSLVIDVGLRNDGPDDVYIFQGLAWGPGGGLVLHLRNQDGAEIPPVVFDDTVMAPPRSQHDSTMFIRLEEGNFFGIRRELPLKDLVKAPGKYSLQVEYRSPASLHSFDKKLQSLPALWQEDPSIFSNEVPIDVVP